MKKLFIILLLLLEGVAFAQVPFIFSNNNATNWNARRGWSCNCVPNLTHWSGRRDTDVSHTKVKNSGITLTNRNYLTIKSGGHLTINGNLAIGSFGYLIVESGGTLIVNGNISYTSRGSITSDGTFIVNGRMNINSNGSAYLRGNTTILTNLTQTGPGDFVTDGVLSIGRDFNVDADGRSDIGGNITVGRNWTTSGSGGAVVTGYIDVTNGRMNVLNDAVVRGTGTLAWGTSNVNPANSPARVQCADNSRYDDNGLTAWLPLPFNPLNLGTCGTVLPITLSDFYVKKYQNELIFYWTTLSETDNDYFLLQTSNDTKIWDDIGYVQGNLTSNHIINYSYASNETNYKYARLKQVDIDGKYSHSKIIYIPKNENLIHFNNNELLINLQKPSSVIILNTNGQVLYSKFLNTGVTTIPLYKEGVFFVSVDGKIYKFFK